MLNTAGVYGYHLPGFLDMAEIRPAHSFQIGRCNNPECPCMHIYLSDENHKPFATATFDKPMAVDIIANLQDYINGRLEH
jgi:hypothetical protein